MTEPAKKRYTIGIDAIVSGEFCRKDARLQGLGAIRGGFAAYRAYPFRARLMPKRRCRLFGKGPYRLARSSPSSTDHS